MPTLTRGAWQSRPEPGDCGLRGTGRCVRDVADGVRGSQKYVFRTDPALAITRGVHLDKDSVLNRTDLYLPVQRVALAVAPHGHLRRRVFLDVGDLVRNLLRIEDVGQLRRIAARLVHVIDDDGRDVLLGARLGNHRRRRSRLERAAIRELVLVGEGAAEHFVRATSQLAGIASSTCPTRFDNSNSGAPIITGRKIAGGSNDKGKGKAPVRKTPLT